jgi:hypothetical protein
MELSRLIVPLGIATYTLLLLAILSGLRRWKLKYHLTFAVLMLVSASLHALIVLFFL